MATWSSNLHAWRFKAAERRAWADAGLWPLIEGGPTPEALHVEFEERTLSFVVYMDHDVDLLVPLAACRGLGGKPFQDVADVRVAPGGRALVWPRLKLTLPVADLVRGRLDVGAMATTSAAARGRSRRPVPQAADAEAARPPEPSQQATPTAPRKPRARRAAAGDAAPTALAAPASGDAGSRPAVAASLPAAGPAPGFQTKFDFVWYKDVQIEL